MGRNKKNYIIAIIVIISIIVPFFIVNSGSLWIDETSTAYFTTFSNVNNLIKNLVSYTGSERQMPGYIMYVWSWVKIFNSSEYMLRISNLLIFFMFLITIYKSNYNNIKKKALILITIFHPFIWYNLNEARSTIILFSLYGIIFLMLDNNFYDDKEKSGINIYIVMLITIIGLFFNMLFYFSILSIIIYLIISNKIQEFLQKKHIWAIILFLLLIVAISIYYLKSLMAGAGGMHEKFGVKNVIYLFYEFLGLNGIGPPRNVLRSNPIIAIKNYLIPIIFLLLVYAIFFIKYFLKKNKRMQTNKILLTFILSLLFFIIISFMFSFKFLTRHVSFLLILVIFSFADMVSESLISKDRINIFMIIIIAISWIVSDINIRFNPYYLKDDYKSAANQLTKFENYKIYYAGSILPSEYYGLYFVNYRYALGKDRIENCIYYNQFQDVPQWPKTRECTLIYNLRLNDLNLLISENENNIIVLFKKYDLFDKFGAIRKFININKYIKIIEKNDYLIYKKVVNGSI